MKAFIKAVTCIALVGSMLLATGCNKKVQIFEKKTELALEEVSDDALQQDIFYVKNGTKFSKVYFPSANFSGTSKKLNKSRIVWFNEDEFMMPEHFKGELLAYASKEASLANVYLERFEDMGYTIGIYGGTIMDDGYYHMSVKANTIEGSLAQTAFGSTESDEIRIITIDGKEPKEVIDKESGIIKGLEQGQKYIIEFYSGTYFYRANFTADKHVFRSFENYSYGYESLSDTTHGYMCFNTPEDLKSGYYLVNGQGLFVYHDYVKGEAPEDENMNISYYDSEGEIISTYTQQYKITIKTATKDITIDAPYGKITDPLDAEEEIKATLVAPDGTEYEMINDTGNKRLTLTLDLAMAGEWFVNITPKSLEVATIDVYGGTEYEETTLYEQTFTIEKDMSYQQFWCHLYGDSQSDISAILIRDDKQTYGVRVTKYYDKDGYERRWLHCEMPYLPAGTYTFKVWYYQSKTTVEDEVHLDSYEETTSDVYEIPEDTDD